MDVKRKNLKEDLKLLVTLSKDYGGERFDIVFSSGRIGNSRFLCSYDGTEYVNCEMVDSTRVLCLLDNHKLPCGLVWVEITVYLNDPQMPDGDFKKTHKGLFEFEYEGEMYHLELTNCKSDDIETPDATFELLGTVLKGEAFTFEDFTEEQLEEFKRPAIEAAAASDEATRNAILATSEAKRQAIEASRAALDADNARQSALSAAKNASDAISGIEGLRISLSNAEGQRAEAERTRNANELSRSSAETKRSQDEYLRQVAEESRISEEKDRKASEMQRTFNEGSRITNENIRTAAEDRRNAAEILRQEGEDRRNSEFSSAQQRRDMEFGQSLDKYEAEAKDIIETSLKGIDLSVNDEGYLILNV